MENLSSFRYPFLAGVVRCDEAECDGVEAEGRRQDFSEELNFTFKPSILLFKLSNLKIMHCTRYLSHALSASIRHKASVNVTVIIMRNVCLHRELVVWSGRGGSGTGHTTLLSLKHSQEGGDGDLWKWICVLDPLLLLLPPLLLMCRECAYTNI